MEPDAGGGNCVSYTFCVNSTCSLEQGEVSSAGCFSDMCQYAPLSWRNTLGISSCNDNETEFCHGSQCGTTCEHSTVDRGEGSLTSCVEGSLVKTSVSQERAQVLTESEADYGRSSHESLAKYDPVSRSWKTHQYSLFGGLTEFSETFPRWGTMRNGELSERTMSEQIIKGKESGYWPTPCASDTRGLNNYEKTIARLRNGESAHLGQLPNFLMVLTGKRGRMNPRFSEKMMMWPEGWANSKPLAMDRFRQWLRSHGISCQAK
jgi:hypothetical protein